MASNDYSTQEILNICFDVEENALIVGTAGTNQDPHKYTDQEILNACFKSATRTLNII